MPEKIKKNKLLSIISVAVVFLVVIAVFSQSLKVAQAPTDNLAAVGGAVADEVTGSFSFTPAHGINLYKFSIDGNSYFANLEQMKVSDFNGESLKQGFTVAQKDGIVTVTINTKELFLRRYDVEVFSILRTPNNGDILSKESLKIKDVKLVSPTATAPTNIINKIFNKITEFFSRLFGGGNGSGQLPQGIKSVDTGTGNAEVK